MPGVFVCKKCDAEFKGNELEYCIFCGEKLKWIGMAPLRDIDKEREDGWKFILYIRW